MNRFTKAALAATFAVGSLAAAGAAFAAGHMTNALETAPQKSGMTVVVKSVTAAHDGWVVIHQIVDGKPVVPASIGHTFVKAGTTENVEVALSEAPASGAVLAMLHVDDGEMGTYEFGPNSVANDKPVVEDGKPVVSPIKLEM